MMSSIVSSKNLTIKLKSFSTLALNSSTPTDSSLDADTVKYLQTLTANGGTISTSTIYIINQFIRDLKHYSLWDKIDDMGVFCGTNLAAGLTKLKYNQGVSLLINHNFVSADFSEGGTAGGLKGDGSTKYLDIGHNVSNVDLNNTAASVYSPTYSGSGVEFGEDQTNRYTLFPGSGNAALGMSGVFSSGRIDLGGLFLATRTTGANLSISWNGDFITSGSADGPVSLFNENCYLFARNENNSAQNLCKTRISMYHIGYGLTQSDCTNFFAVVQKFQTSLGRQFIKTS